MDIFGGPLLLLSHQNNIYSARESAIWTELNMGSSFLYYLALASLGGKSGLESSQHFLTQILGIWYWDDSKSGGWNSWHSLSISVCLYGPSMWFLQHSGSGSWTSVCWLRSPRHEGERRERERKRQVEKTRITCSILGLSTEYGLWEVREGFSEAGKSILVPGGMGEGVSHSEATAQAKNQKWTRKA